MSRAAMPGMSPAARLANLLTKVHILANPRPKAGAIPNRGGRIAATPGWQKEARTQPGPTAAACAKSHTPTATTMTPIPFVMRALGHLRSAVMPIATRTIVRRSMTPSASQLGRRRERIAACRCGDRRRGRSARHAGRHARVGAGGGQRWAHVLRRCNECQGACRPATVARMTGYRGDVGAGVAIDSQRAISPEARRICVAMPARSTSAPAASTTDDRARVTPV